MLKVHFSNLFNRQIIIHLKRALMKNKIHEYAMNCLVCVLFDVKYTCYIVHLIYCSLYAVYYI